MSTSRSASDGTGGGAAAQLSIAFNSCVTNEAHIPAFPSNAITTSKYTALNFLPVNLFEQFRRFANVYFLVITAMQAVPIISPFPIYTSLVPLVFILLVSALKEALEDWGRHKADNHANGRKYLVLMEPAEIALAAANIANSCSSLPESSHSSRQAESSYSSFQATKPLAFTPSKRKAAAALLAAQGEACFRSVTSADIRVGQILRIMKDEEFPADMLLLSSSASDATAFVNTSTLDGEAVPKIRSAPQATLHLITPSDVSSIRGNILVEPPSASMYRFQGRIELDATFVQAHQSKMINGSASIPLPRSSSHSRLGLSRSSSAMSLVGGSYQSPLNDQQLLLRGSKLVNTAWVFGVVIYCGSETKLMLNRNAPRFKFSKFERILNSFVVQLFIFNLLVCAILATGHVIRGQSFAEVWDIHEASEGKGWILNMLTQYILFSFMIPMSLYVTIELVKVGQSKFMEWDTRMMYRDLDSTADGGPGHGGDGWKHMIVKNSSICEELGMIDSVFSDKTGTLTSNKMELTAVSVGGTLYRDVGSADPAATAAEASQSQPVDVVPAAVSLRSVVKSPLATRDEHGIAPPSRRPSLEEPLYPSDLSEPSPRSAPLANGLDASPASSSSPLLHTDLVLQDLVNRAFASFSADANAKCPSDSIELDYLLDLLCCNSVMPMRKAKTSGAGADDDDYDDDDDDFDVAFDDDDGDDTASDVQFTRSVMVDRIAAEDAARLPAAVPSVFGTPSRVDVTGSFVPRIAVSAVPSPSPASHSSATTAARQQAHLAHLVDASFTFSSSSPDEIALCESLDRCGLTLVERRGAQLTLRYTAPGSTPRFLRFTIRATLDFTSTRARMDVVIETPEGQVKVFVKGSDQQVIRLLKASPVTTAAPRAGLSASALLDVTSQQLSAFATTGSRTLLMAGRTLSAASAARFQTLYEDAANSLHDREKLVEQAFVSLEAEGLELLGSSAVEDQLQEGVPEAVDFLLKGGLRLVILTGDKLETSLSIGYQCNVLQPHMTVLKIVACETEQAIETMLKDNLRIVLETPPTDEASRSGAELARQRRGDAPLPPLAVPRPPLLGYALAIDGSSLEVCLRNYRDDFIALFLHTATIISYRSTPKQKSLAVRVVKEALRKTTLAIGDGANDVSMILEAHVGVGILGKEGSHAALSSDYVVHRFVHLIPLMFLHGRYNYYRTAMCVFFSFFKNLLFPMPMVIFSFYSYNSGQVLFIPALMSCFNLFFTSLPPIITGWYERDVPESVLLRNPAAYASFKRFTIFNLRHFLQWMAQGVFYGFILWFVMWAMWGGSDNGIGSSIFYESGFSTTLWESGTQIFLAVIVLANLKMTTTLHRITVLNILAALIGVGMLLLILVIMSWIYMVDLAPDAYGLSAMIFRTHITWLYLLLAIVMCYVPSLAVSAFSELYHPTPNQLMARICSHQTAADDNSEYRTLIELLERGGSTASTGGRSRSSSLLHHPKKAVGPSSTKKVITTKPKSPSSSAPLHSPLQEPLLA